MNRHNFLKILFLSSLILSLTFFITSVSRAQFNGFDSESAEKLVEAKAVFSVSSAAVNKRYRGAVIVDIISGWHINSAAPYEDYLIPAELTFDTTDGITVTEILYPDASETELLGQKMSVYEGREIIFFNLKIDASTDSRMYDLPVHFTFQPCNDKECRAPETIDINLKVNVGVEGTLTHKEIFTDNIVSDAVAVETTNSDTPKTDIQIMVEKYGTWGYILALGLAFVTGLLLSFSPCTYPMVPITVSIFAGQKRSVGRGFILSLFYVGTMAVVYGIMGLVVSMVGGVFGAWLASTPVVIGIAVVFVIFSLSMFGVYNLEVPMSLRNKLGTAKTSGGVTGAIVLGVVAALVVSPCVGPFVAGILLYIATFGSPIFGFLVLFVFAIGLGTLYIIIGTFSSAISSLPGAGGWMESVKKFFGFVLLFMALYFLRTLLPEDLIMIITALLLLILSVFGGGFDRLTADSKMFDRIKKLIGLLAFVIGLYLLLGTMLRTGFILPAASNWLTLPGVSSVEEQSLIDWDTDLEIGLSDALAQNKPVLIDTWATWCVNCKVLDKKTFGNEKVADEARRFKSLKIQLEKYDSPETKAFMQRFNLKLYSLPTVLLLDSKGKVVHTIQGVVGPDEMVEKMQQVL